MATITIPRGFDEAYYKKLYDSLAILPHKLEQVKREAQRMLDGFKSYDAVEKQTAVPWWFHGAVHEMECDCNWRCQILNGQKWDRVTTIVPKNEGPWKSWVESAVFALKRKRAEDKTWTPLDEIGDWTIAITLREWEKWNGGGYKRRGLNSPYVWAGSIYGVGVGYYTSDGKYSPAAESKQIGAGVLLWWLKNRHRVSA